MCLINGLLAAHAAVPHDHGKISMDHRMTNTTTMLSTAMRIIKAAPAIMLRSQDTSDEGAHNDKLQHIMPPNHLQIFVLVRRPSLKGLG